MYELNPRKSKNSEGDMLHISITFIRGQILLVLAGISSFVFFALEFVVQLADFGVISVGPLNSIRITTSIAGVIGFACYLLWVQKMVNCES